MDEHLPKGIYYERSRSRYRVRVYKFGNVVHCSYHRDIDLAVDALHDAKAERDNLEPEKETDKVHSGVKTEQLLERLL